MPIFCASTLKPVRYLIWMLFLSSAASALEFKDYFPYLAARLRSSSFQVLKDKYSGAQARFDLERGLRTEVCSFVLQRISAESARKVSFNVSIHGVNGEREYVDYTQHNLFYQFSGSFLFRTREPTVLNESEIEESDFHVYRSLPSFEEFERVVRYLVSSGIQRKAPAPLISESEFGRSALLFLVRQLFDSQVGPSSRARQERLRSELEQIVRGLLQFPKPETFLERSLQAEGFQKSLAPDSLLDLDREFEKARLKKDRARLEELASWVAPIVKWSVDAKARGAEFQRATEHLKLFAPSFP